jgi:hypothetical protein
MEKENAVEPESVAKSPASKPEAATEPVNGKPSDIRFASDEQFKKAHRKTSALHGGLFRRLAK